MASRCKADPQTTDFLLDSPPYRIDQELVAPPLLSAPFVVIVVVFLEPAVRGWRLTPNLPLYNYCAVLSAVHGEVLYRPMHSSKSQFFKTIV